MFERIEGAAQEFAGSVEDEAGKAIGKNSMRLEGQARQVAGRVQHAYSDAAHQVRKAAIAYPMGTIALVGSIGFILGAILSRR